MGGFSGALGLLLLLAFGGVALAQSPSPSPAPDPYVELDRPWAVGVSPAQREKAFRLFREANALFAESQHAAALAKYKEAIASWNHPAIHYNIAVALIRLDEPVEAYQHLIEALKYGKTPLEADEYEQALTYQKLLAGHLGELRVTCLQPDAEVALDGELLFKAPGYEVRLLRPGSHQLVVSKPGYLTDTRAVTLPPGKVVGESIWLVSLKSLPRRRWPMWKPLVIFGVGVALGAALGGVFLNNARNDYVAYDDAVARSCQGGCDCARAPSAGKKSSGDAWLGTGIALSSAAGVVAVAGAVMLLLNQSKLIDKGKPARARAGDAGDLPGWTVRALLVAACALGCIRPASIDCGPLVCPSSQVCFAALGRCVDAEQITACSGQADGAACRYSGLQGTCSLGVCDGTLCGDGIARAPEECDGAPPSGRSCLDYGFDAGRLGCSATCTVDVSGCRSLGWVPMSTKPSETMLGLWGAGTDATVLAVGEGGTIRSFDGVSRWTPMMSGTTHWLNAIGGSSDPLLAFAVGESGTILSYDGGAWSPLSSGTNSDLYGVWSAGASQAIAVGAHGAALRWDGSRWTQLASGTSDDLFAVHGRAADDIVAVGAQGTMLRFDGKSWSPYASPVAVGLHAVWLGPTVAFAVGDQGTILQYGPGGWSAVPTPTHEGLQALWGSGDSDVSAVGQAGTTLHYDGHSWSQQASPTQQPLHALWGTPGDPERLLAVGDQGAAIARSGAGWTDLSGLLESDLKQVWGSGARDVFAVGSAGTILHYDGTRWTQMLVTAGGGATPDFTSVSGSGASNVYAVAASSLYQYDGTSWTEQSGISPRRLTAVWVNSPGDVYVVGVSGTVVHYDGSEWVPENPGANVTFHDVRGASSVIFAVGDNGVIRRRNTNGSWNGTLSGTNAQLTSVWVSLSGEAFAVGTGGTILYYDGTTWSAMGSGTDEDFTSVWGSDPDNVYAAGLGGVFHWDGAAWARLTTAMTAVWGSGPDDVFSVGGNRIAHYGGAGWIAAAGSPGAITSLWGTGGVDVFAAGKGGQLSHFDGSTWTAMPSGTTADLNDLWGTGGSDVFAVGAAGTVIHYDGTAWASMVSPATEDLHGLAGLGLGNLFAVGDAGRVLRWDGQSWTALSAGTAESLRGAWGSAADDLFAVGDLGTIVHFDGTLWQPMSVATQANLSRVWGTGASDVYAVGDGGTILHYDGSVWSPMVSNTDAALGAVWGTSSNDVFAVGQDVVLRWNGGGWTPIRPSSSGALSAVWGVDNRVFVGGAAGSVFELLRTEQRRALTTSSATGGR